MVIPMSRLSFMAMIAACLLPMLWPGDVSWVNDEPTLVGLALDANEAGRPATHGLSGSRGWRYGPLPVWLLQVSLLASHNPIALAACRSALFCLAMCAALWTLARRCRWSAWGALPLVLSPYLWFYARGLWDNTWPIPLGALALGFVAEWRETRRPVWLALVLVCLWAMLLVHLMAISLAAPVLAYVVWFERAGLAKHKRMIAVVVALVGLASAGYLCDARTATWRDDGARTWEKTVAPLWGPRSLSSYGLDYFLGYEWLDADTETRGALLLLCNLESLIVVPLCWIGFATTVVGAVRRWRRRDDWTTRDRVLALAASGWLIQVILHAALNVPGDPHYGNAVWIGYVLLAWSVVHAGWQWSAARAAWLTHAAACGLALGLVVARLHETGGTRSLGYGPSLSSQWEAVSQISECAPDAAVATEIDAWLAFPQAPATLVRLRGGRTGRDAKAGSCAVVYRDERADRAWLKTVRQPRRAD